ncbi:MAG: universal stress protein, partial [Flavobacteriales bacterium]|nr:universal stress protein [Flavobacteriales bacterium]
MKNILVTVDLDEQSNPLLEKAEELAQKFNSKLWLVHIAPPEPDFIGYSTGPQYIRDILAQDLRKEHKMIQEMSKNLKEKGIESEGLLIQGMTADTIAEEAKKLKVDLIIIGHHKRGF